MTVVGQRVPMPDGRERVSGSAIFAGNVELPGMLRGKFLRSPYAHARIVKLDTGRAERLPGVVAVLTGSRLLNGPLNPYYGPVLPDRPLVAIEKVRYAGEPVAAVAAVDVATAVEALELIDVEYDELPALITPEQALEPHAPAIHD